MICLTYNKPSNIKTNKKKSEKHPAKNNKLGKQLLIPKINNWYSFKNGFRNNKDMKSSVLGKICWFNNVRATI